MQAYQRETEKFFVSKENRFYIGSATGMEILKVLTLEH